MLLVAAAVRGHRERVQVDLASVVVPQRDGGGEFVAEDAVALGPKPLHKPMDGLLVDREVKVGMWPGLLAMMVVEIVGLDAAWGSPRPSA